MLWKVVQLTYEYQNERHTLKGSLPLSDRIVSLESRESGITFTCDQRVKLLSFEASIPWTYNRRDCIFVHGFQSWSDSREFIQEEKLPGLPPALRFAYDHYHLDFYGDYHFYPYTRRRGGFHSHGWTLSGHDHSWHLVGSLDEESAYTIFEHHPQRGILRIVRDVLGWELEPGDTFLLRLFFSSGELIDTQHRYFAALGLKSSRLPKVAGWTSWYNYYTTISEEIILSNLEAFHAHHLPLDIFQIDDGYQTAVGDWLSLKPSFPHGMKYIADRIHEKGFQAGLWLAPFVCERKSLLYREHPDWILCDAKKAFVIAGYSENWNGDFYALDLDHPGVRAYLENVFHTVLHAWGFDMVKLDFLYAASLVPHAGKTRARRMSDAMKWLRQLVGEKKILACGVPITSAMGRVEYCRIGCDVGLDWEDVRPARIHFRERISTIKAITTTLGRFPLHRRVFLNDPDVFILRQENQHLTAEQQYTLYMVNNLFGGVVFTSDDPAQYSETTLNLYKKQFPLAEPEVLFLSHHHDVYRFRPRSAYFQAIGPVKVYEAFYTGWLQLPFCKAFFVVNTGHKTISQKLPEGVFFDPMSKDFLMGNTRIPPYATRLFLTVQVEKKWQYGGSTEHIFPGFGIRTLEIIGEKVWCDPHPVTPRGGELVLVSSEDTPLFSLSARLPITRHPLGFFYTTILV